MIMHEACDVRLPDMSVTFGSTSKNCWQSANYIIVELKENNNMFGSGKCQTCRVGQPSRRYLQAPQGTRKAMCADGIDGNFYAFSPPAKKVGFTIRQVLCELQFANYCCPIYVDDQKKILDLARTPHKLNAVVAQDAEKGIPHSKGEA